MVVTTHSGVNAFPIKIYFNRILYSK